MIFDEVREVIMEFGGETINLCQQCGLCASICPWSKTEKKSEFNIRQMMHMGRLGYEGFESDDILFACTSCGQCVTQCTREVKIIEIVRAMRTIISETGAIPKNLKTVLGSINSQGNPWSQEKDERVNWFKDLAVPTFTADHEYLLYVCCTSAYDGRSQKIAVAVTELLQKAGISFGVIGNKERCCGESIRKIGAEDVFAALAEGNIEVFKAQGVKKIITTSPHCFYTFQKEYPEFGGEFEVIHYTELFHKLVEEGKLTFSKPLTAKTIYHEPCYLGRHSGSYDAPRQLLKAALGTQATEFDDNKENSRCCGGGGARIWMETETGQRFSDQKIKEAAAKEVQTVVTACPYCIVMLEDSCKTLNKDQEIAVKDISEILKESL